MIYFIKQILLCVKNVDGVIDSCSGRDKDIDDMLESYKSLIVQQLGF